MAQEEREYLSLKDAAAYLGISTVKMGRLIKEGTVSYTTDPLDKRVKLIKRADVDRLRRESRRG